MMAAFERYPERFLGAKYGQGVSFCILAEMRLMRELV